MAAIGLAAPIRTNAGDFKNAVYIAYPRKAIKFRAYTENQALRSPDPAEPGMRGEHETSAFVPLCLQPTSPLVALRAAKWTPSLSCQTLRSRGLADAAPGAGRRSPRPHSFEPVRIVASLASIRARIASLEQTRKLTEAVRVVAMAKVHRAQQAVVSRRPFAREILRLLYRLINRLEFEGLDSPLFSAGDPDKERVLMLVIGADRGLCGSYNAVLAKEVVARASTFDMEDVEYDMIVIGKRAEAYLARRNYPIVQSFQQHDFTKPDTALRFTSNLTSLILEANLRGFNRVEVCYCKFINAVAFKPVIQTLLPINVRSLDISSLGDDQMLEEMSPAMNEEVSHGSGMFDRDLETEDLERLLDSLIALYVRAQIYRMCCESVASELSSRLAAMTVASDNAAAAIKQARIELNRNRQQIITQEICMLVANFGLEET